MKVSSSKVVRISAGALLSMLSAAGPRAVAEDAATVSLASNGIMFHSIADGADSTLRVSCTDGYYFEEHYTDTVSISFALPQVTGQCKYELRTHPVVDSGAVGAAKGAGDEQRVRKLLAEARQQVRVSIGSFQVVNSVIVAPQPRANALGGEAQ